MISHISVIVIFINRSSPFHDLNFPNNFNRIGWMNSWSPVSHNLVDSRIPSHVNKFAIGRVKSVSIERVDLSTDLVCKGYSTIVKSSFLFIEPDYDERCYEDDWTYYESSENTAARWTAGSTCSEMMLWSEIVWSQMMDLMLYNSAEGIMKSKTQ